MSSFTDFPGQRFFDVVYRGDVPWDIGAPQPDLIQVVEEFPPPGQILDLGCGTGDLALALAGRGLSVVGVDFVEAAIDVARTRLAGLPAEQRSLVEVQIADALRPSQWAGEVAAVVDSGFFHLFDTATREALVEDLARTLPPGGRYYMLGFAIALPAPDVPREVTVEEIRSLFSERGAWIVRALRPARFVTNGFDAIPALVLCAERAGTVVPR